jgi:hypothetical protein
LVAVEAATTGLALTEGLEAAAAVLDLEVDSREAQQHLVKVTLAVPISKAIHILLLAAVAAQEVLVEVPP